MKAFVYFIFASFLFCSCHALVVADKLYFQGSVAKKQPKVTLDSTSFVSTPSHYED